MGKYYKIVSGIIMASILLLMLVGCSPDNNLPPTYLVTYNGNGNTDGTVPVDANTYLAGATVICALQGDLTRTGYTFGGWNTASDGSGTDYTEDASFTLSNSSITLYVKWMADFFTVTLSTTPVDLSIFNDTFKYSMVSAMPGIAAQGSGSPDSYPFTLVTTSLPILRNLLFDPMAMVLAEAPDYSVYDAKKKYADIVLRAEEERLLKGGLPQLGKNVQEKGVYPSASILIVVGTAWDGVNILFPTLTTIATTCKYIADHAYFFVDNNDIDTMESSLSNYAAAFDALYDDIHNKFGIENDVDENGKVIIVFSHAIESPILGYFNSGDKYPNTTYHTSNEGDIFYLSTTAPIGVTCGAMAHEFQHMIYFDQHYNEGVTSTFVWLNEALSQAAEYYSGYTDNHLAWIQSFLLGGWQDLSLTNWTSNNYGYGAIFMRYLVDQFGASAIKDMCSTANTGIDAVEKATGESFNTIFKNFLVALVIDGTEDSLVPAYEFKTLDLLKLQPTGRGGLLPEQEFSVATSSSDSVLPYGIGFLKWRGSFGTMSLSGTGVDGTALGVSQ